MAVPAAFVARSIIFKLGTTAYECAVTSVQVNKNVPTASVTTMCPAGTITDVGTPTASVVGTALVDMTAGSLYAFLTDHHGEKAAFEINPTGEAAVKMSGTVTVVAPSASFSPTAFSTFNFSLPVDGEVTEAWKAAAP